MNLFNWLDKLQDSLRPKPPKQLGCNAQFYLHNINAPDARCIDGWVEEGTPCPKCYPEAYENNGNLKPPKIY